jgi:hypothetical protein
VVQYLGSTSVDDRRAHLVGASADIRLAAGTGRAQNVLLIVWDTVRAANTS